jgi:7,8-dihydropterin-6-yl-methyl-4-(beta-D-ribofuranosyl)aminobenzene 5'-phosphate synthase
MTVITTLIENGKGEQAGLDCEHGLSFLIQAGEQKVLFDTGQSGKFLGNAKKLGIDLSTVEDVVLSHGHYDHTGGLTAFLDQVKTKAKVHVGKGFFVPKYVRKEKSVVYRGNSFTREQLEAGGWELVEHEKDLTEIVPGIHLVRNFSGISAQEWKNPRFIVPEGDNYTVDDFSDEVVLVVSSSRGLILVTGCSHPGILNILSAVKQRFPDPVYAVLGGTHLVEASDLQLAHAVAAFKKYPDLLLGTCHCTGDVAMERLKEVCPRSYPNHTGDSLIIE